MQGLINGAQQAPQQPNQPPQGQGRAAPQKPAQQGQHGQQKRLESQEAYDLAAGQMLNFVYDERGIQALNRMVQAADDPVAGMARLFGRLLMNTTQSAAVSGKRVAPPLVFQAGIEVIRALSEVAQSQGLINPENEKAIAEDAFYDGIALFAQEAAEEALTEDERQEYVKLLEIAEQMEQQGGGMPEQSRQGQQGAPRQQPQSRPGSTQQPQVRG